MQRIWTGMILALIGLAGPAVAADAMSRMQLSNLRATRASLEELRDQWQQVEVPETEFTDFRAQMHVHSHWRTIAWPRLRRLFRRLSDCQSQVIMFNDLHRLTMISSSMAIRMRDGVLRFREPKRRLAVPQSQPARTV